jgi:hypothetical protein
MHTIIHSRTGMSVVFVHGILSTGEKCWTSTNGTYWPTVLSQDPSLEGLGIYDFSYRADFFNPNFTPLDAANFLKEELYSEKLLQSRRLIFVCHSLGGIVVRQFLVNEAPDLISKHHIQRIGLFLIASPSLGSNYANLITSLAAFMGIRNPQANSLTYGNNNIWLTTLDQNFKKLLDRGELSIFGKELIEDEAIEGVNKLSDQVLVAYYSGKRYFGEYYKVPNSNHTTIAKPESAKATQHKSLVRFIQEMLPETHIEGEGAIETPETQQAIHLLHQLETVIDRQIKMFRSLSGIQRALEETFAYSTSSEGVRIASKEKHLSELWEDASLHVLPHNRDLGNLCSLEGHAWADFQEWSRPESRELLIRVKDKVERVLNLGEVTNPSRSLASFLGVTSVPRVRRKFGIFLPSFQGGGPLYPEDGAQEEGALTRPFQGATYAVADIWAAWAVASLLVQVEGPTRVRWYPRPHSGQNLEKCSHHFFIGGKSNSMSMDTISRSGGRFRMDCKEDSDKWFIEDTQTNQIFDVPNPWKDRGGYEASAKDYGLIGRVSSSQKVQFFISGLGSRATEALGYYLMENWDELATLYGSNDFVALFECKKNARHIGGQNVVPTKE